MRQAVTARGLASSPPAPSPSKRPKRAGPQLPPAELARLAQKQKEVLKALINGSRRPYPGPCGLEGQVEQVVKFGRDAHVAWTAVSFLSDCLLPSVPQYLGSSPCASVFYFMQLQGYLP